MVRFGPDVAVEIAKKSIYINFLKLVAIVINYVTGDVAFEEWTTS